MKLQRVHLDAYRSLLDLTLEVTHPCMGMVGINESGKSNILRALLALSPKNPLTHSDIPRMARDRAPSIRFVFDLTQDEVQQLPSYLEGSGIHPPTLGSILQTKSLTVVYHVEYDPDDQQEHRFFTVDSLPMPGGTLVRRPGAKTDGFLVELDGQAVPLQQVIFMSAEDLGRNKDLLLTSKSLSEARTKLAQLEAELAEMKSTLVAQDAPESSQAASSDSSEEPADGKDTKAATPAPDPELAKAIEAKQQQIKRAATDIESLAQKTAEFDIQHQAESAQLDRDRAQADIERLQKRIATESPQLVKLEKIDAPNDEQKKQITALRKSAQEAKAQLAALEAKLPIFDSIIESLTEPLHDKFSEAIDDLATLLGSLCHDRFAEWLPPVVFWTYSSDYILPGETEFRAISRADSLNDISRPLVNLFRIGLRIQSLAGLKRIIKEIQTDRSERRRYEDKLNLEMQQYLHDVWPDYNQQIRISLEQERILVQFFDPSSDDASYYEMLERSQGCQTFISFLLTVGAEAKHGVLKNTILLLDEPETHLHPSGARFMLAELIRAAESGNTVLYATHSIFMVDKAAYERHLIIEKLQERTGIKASSRDRVGYFMQEEVLYGAIDIEFGDALPSRNEFNFVLEGDGDTKLFSHYYRTVLRSDGDSARPFPLNRTSIYQGGKCSDIERYLKNRPIQLGTKWVFLLDNDAAAANLRKFVESRYKAYVGTDVFIYQYSLPSTEHQVEFEDLLPSQLLSGAAEDALRDCGAEATPPAPQRGQPFSDYFSLLAATLPDRTKDLKAAFKSHLNARVTDAAQRIKDEKQFEAEFPDYAKWTLDVIQDLRSKLQTASGVHPGSTAKKPN
jgi:hypothetical protein